MNQLSSRRKRVSIVEVAKRAGVGTTSITRFFDPRKRLELSKETCLKIEKVVKELNYFPRASARRGRAGKTTYTLGALTSLSKDIFHSRYHTEILSGIFDRIAETSHELKFFLLKDRHYQRIEEVLFEHGLDGLLILTWRIHPNVVRLVEQSKGDLPLVIFNDYDSKLKVNILYTDVREGMRQAVIHLLERGYKNIAMLKGPSHILFRENEKVLRVPSIDARQKAQGFMDGLRERGIQIQKTKMIRECPSYLEGDGYHEIRNWIRRNRKALPEAFVCANDDIAIGALRAIKEAGLSCPKDIALVGFDDIEKARLVTPALTTVKQPLYQMGKDAVNLLIKSLSSPDKSWEHKSYVPELMVRSTT